MSEAFARVDTALFAQADEHRASNEKRYLKSNRRHIGCGMKVVDAEVRTLKREGLSREQLVALIEELWDSGVFELCMVAAKLAGAEASRFGPADLYLFEQMIRESGGWALVDTLSTGIVCHIVEAFPEQTSQTLDRWSGDPDFWIRRASMLSLLKPLRRGAGDWQRFTRYADAMLEEKEFFIRKAIGWVLRETSKERPDMVFAWLEPRVRRTSGVTFREAAKYLTDAQRARLRDARSSPAP